MEKRKIIIGNYDTAANGWTLAAWNLAAAEPKTHYVDKPSGDGSWDLSTALTEGVVKYNDRELTATLECSDGDRLSREERIRQMINRLDGLRLELQVPDDAYHYLVGRVRVVREYNNLAHASVSVRAICEPWKYSNVETVAAMVAATSKKTIELINNGRRAVVPTLTVTGSGASVLLQYGTASTSLSAGTYRWPELLLTPGEHILTYSGTGTVTATYREAVLE